MDLVGSYRCDCKSGYTGSNCETGNISHKRPSIFLNIINEIFKITSPDDSVL